MKRPRTRIASGAFPDRFPAHPGWLLSEPSAPSGSGAVGGQHKRLQEVPVFAGVCRVLSEASPTEGQP
jgi:hypothetical protein